jgi:multiple sugar transport system substrate-binding protein
MKKKVLSKILWVLMILILVSPLFAEGSNEKEELENIELEYVCFDDQAGTFVWFEDVFARYQEENPNITIKVTGIPSGEYEKLTMLQMSVGKAPDIYPMFSSQLVNVLNNDMLEPLDKWIKGTELDERLLPLTREVASKDGELYALIRALPPWVLQANTKLLDEAGVTSIPKTIEELYEAIKIVEKNTDKYGYVTWLDFSNDFNVMRSVLSWLIGFGGHWGLEPGKLTIYSEANVEALSWLQKLVAEGLIPLGIDEKISYDMFKKGEIAMLIAGTWLPGMVQGENPDFFENYLSVSKVPFPTQNSLVGGGWVGIPAASKNKDAAWDLLSYMYSSENQVKWIETATRYGSTTDQPTDDWVNNKAPWFPVITDVAENNLVGIGYDPAGLEAYAGEFRKAMMPYIVDIISNGAPVASTLKEAQMEMEKWAATK